MEFVGEEETVPPEGLFRASKRRKVIRRPNDVLDPKLRLERGTTSENRAPPASPNSLETAMMAPNDQTPPITGSQSNPEDEISLTTEILRRRDTAKSRRGGIKFANTAQQRRQEKAQEQGVQLSTEARPSALEAAAGRFAPQTGQVVETLNKHMMEYVDSEMAKVYQQRNLAPLSTHHNSAIDCTSQMPIQNVGLEPLQRQPATLGKLQEIDLGPDAVQRNMQLTEAATRRLHGAPSADDAQPDSRPGRVRLGRDGRPRPPPKWKKRRTSDDIKRDEMVEALLKENKLDLYDEPVQTSLNAADNEGAADDILADQFRREFLESMQSRQQSKRPPGGGKSATASVGKVVDPLARGPKLGGSRSARAAMHRAQEEKMGKKR